MPIIERLHVKKQLDLIWLGVGNFVQYVHRRKTLVNKGIGINLVLPFFMWAIST